MMKTRINKYVLLMMLFMLTRDVDSKAVGSDVKEEVLKNLFITEAKTVRIRNTLEGMAEILKEDCEDLISLYEDPDLLSTEDQLGKLETAIDLFVESARNAKKTLTEAGDLLANAQEVFARTRAALNIYDGELKRVKQFITEDSKKTVHSIQMLIKTLIEKNKGLNDYVETELELMDEWKVQLQTSISNQEGITDEDIKWRTKILINNLKALIAACDGYLTHELPSVGRKKRGLPVSTDSRSAISGYPGTAQTFVAQWPHAVARRSSSDATGALKVIKTNASPTDRPIPLTHWLS